MELLVQLALLLIGLGALVKGADVFVDASCRIARSIGVSELVVGLTLVAAGTSLPELAVSSLSALYGYADIAVANIVGSNIYNIFVIIGITGILVGHKIRDSRVLDRDAVWLLLASIIFVFLSVTGTIGREYGVLMLLLYAVYLATLYWHEKDAAGKRVKERLELATVALCLVGVAAVGIGGNLTVNSAVELARMLGVPEWLVGATIVAAGTSLPETVTSIVAVRKNKVELSLGNIIGSNIFNILFVIGAAAIIRPLTISFAAVAVDYMFMVGAAVFATLLLIRGRFHTKTGIVSLLAYVAYIAILVLRG
jgi:cation:H+ antiporter